MQKYLNIASVKPIDITRCQEECANTFGFDFDIKFCKIQESELINDEHSRQARNDSLLPDLEPKFSNSLGIQAYCSQPAKPSVVPLKRLGKRDYQQTFNLLEEFVLNPSLKLKMQKVRESSDYEGQDASETYMALITILNNVNNTIKAKLSR